MDKLKRLIVSIGVAIAVYMAIQLIFNNIFSNINTKSIYVIANDIEKGKQITEKDLKKIEIKSDKSNIDEKYIKDKNMAISKITSKELKTGDINVLEFLKDISEYEESSNQENELISIKLENPDQAISYQIEKNTKVNLYFLGKSDIVEKIDGNKSIKIDSTNHLNSVIELLNGINIKGIYDKYGNKIKHASSESIVDTVLFEVSKEDAMIINSLKGLGRFDMTKVY